MLRVSPKIQFILISLSLCLLAILFYPNFDSEILFPDSSSYIGHDANRGLVYPYFLDLVGPALKTGQPYTSMDFHRVSWAQWVLVLISALLFFLVLLRMCRSGWPSLLFIFLFVSHKLIFPNASMVGNITSHTSFILTEGLVPTWVFLITALLLSFYRTPSAMTALILGLMLFLGIELTPRFMFLSVLCLFPILYELLRSSFNKKSLLPLLVFLVLYLAKCTWTYIHHEVFSSVPFDGITLIGPAIQFSNEEDIVRFTNTEEKLFVTAIIRDSRRREAFLYSPSEECTPVWNDPFIIRNQYVIALSNYKKLVDSSDTQNMNLFLSRVAKKLLLGSLQNVKRWLHLFFSSVWFLFTNNAFFTLIHLLLFVFLSYHCLYIRSDSPFYWTAFSLLTAHLTHTLGVVLISYPERRYLSSSEMFVPFVILFVYLEYKKKKTVNA